MLLPAPPPPPKAKLASSAPAFGAPCTHCFHSPVALFLGQGLFYFVTESLYLLTVFAHRVYYYCGFVVVLKSGEMHSPPGSLSR